MAEIARFANRSKSHTHVPGVPKNERPRQQIENRSPGLSTRRAALVCLIVAAVARLLSCAARLPGRRKRPKPADC